MEDGSGGGWARGAYGCAVTSALYMVYGGDMVSRLRSSPVQPLV